MVPIEVMIPSVRHYCKQIADPHTRRFKADIDGQSLLVYVKFHLISNKMKQVVVLSKGKVYNRKVRP